jgi:hydrogenase maturation factor
MKLEKREITLNEADSLTDVFYTEKNLILHYGYAMESVQTKETRAALVALMKETGEDLYFTRDLMAKSLQSSKGL